MYTISYPSGTLRLDGVVVEQNDCLPAYKAYAAWLAQGNGPEVLDDETPPRNKIQINAWQLRRSLNHFALRDSVEAAVAASENKDMQDGYNHSPTFSSDEPMTLGLGAALGQSEGAMYALFEYGAAL